MRDEIRDCPACGERTAHQTRGFAWATLFGGALAVLGFITTAVGFPIALPLSVPMALLGVWMVAHDRQQRWDIACGRCRGKAVALQRWSIARTSTIDIS